MPRTLTPRERSFLKARAHSLEPVVMIGAQGLTSAVLSEIDRALTAHELIKVRAGGDDRDTREALLGEICRRTDASPVGRVGKVLILWRERPVPAADEESPPRHRRRPRLE